MNFPKKSLGQHWLEDDKTLDAICDMAELTSDDTVLEIGPGQGSLTQKLAQRAGQVIAIEKDEKLAQDLTPHLQIAKNLQILEGDILKFDLTSLPPGYKVVANIPYYLTSHLLRLLCESSNPPKLAALLVQKEVAQRVAAQPGAMSLLSVSVQFYCDVALGPIVAARLFTPPPKVDSQILILKYRTKPLFENVDTKKLFQIVKAGFANRRKTLLNSLGAGLHLEKTQTLELLQKAGINPGVRAQELSLEEWQTIYSQIQLAYKK